MLLNAENKSLIEMLRCLDDVDDEVRDRAAMYLRVMKEASLADAYVKEGMHGLFLLYVLRLKIYIESVFSLAALESKLVAYVNDVDASAQPFDTSSIPKISRAQLAAESTRQYTCFLFFLILMRF